MNDDDNKYSNELNLILNDFYQNIYNKKNNLNFKNFLTRKQFCIKTFKILKRILLNKTEEEIKKMIIFIEYKIRSEDPTFGKNYHKLIKRLYDSIKNKNKNTK